MKYIICGDTYFEGKVPEGTKIKFVEEKQQYTVMASNHYLAVCTKPFNIKKTVLYTIIDWFERIRGPEDLIFGMGAETKKQCREMLKRITNGDTAISSRHCIKLNIEKVTLI